jgi:ABC-2 type transport system ATP-binding protein
MCRRVGIIRAGRIVAVEDIEGLRKKQLRRIKVEFPGPGESGAIAVEGMISPRADKNGLSFMYSGSMDALITALAGKSIDDLIIEEPTLEEIFMHYYSENPETDKALRGGDTGKGR